MREAEWVREFAIRKELGGYYPEDPFKADFFTGLIAIQHKQGRKKNVNRHLQNLILKNS